MSGESIGWFVVFSIGSVLYSFPLARLIQNQLFGRRSRLVFMLERMKQREAFRQRMKRLDLGQASPKERHFIEKARLAGLSLDWTLVRFQWLQGLLFLTIASLFVLAELTGDQGAVEPNQLGISLIWFLKLTFSLGAGWAIPLLWLSLTARSRRGQLLMEISALSHRLSVCVSDRADIRDLLIRAGRTLVLLKPQLQELAVMWGKDRQEAIWRFRDAVGITEVYPLVNALEAVCRADPGDVAKVLKEQTAGIEATLAAEVNRKLENAPIWISFYIMIPFSVILLLFLYPWLITISEQLLASFQA